MHFNWYFFSYNMQNLEYNNKSFENSSGLHAHQTATVSIEQLQFWKQGPTLQKRRTGSLETI